MNDDQELVGWLAVFLILMVVWLVYRPQVSAIIFGSTPKG